MNHLFTFTIAELIQHYKKKTHSPVEVMRATLAQLELWEPHLNAFISVFADQAIARAEAAEALYFSNAPTAPLTGIPVTLKDLVDTAGERTTCGSRILRNHIPDVSAVVAQRIAATGGLVFGKTNLLEFAYGAVHPDYGQTNNPYDVTRTSGGSSGGAAASIAAGIGFAAVGTDTGGSIRIPASYCGVVGLKPTYGLVDAKGVFPLSQSLDHVGPIARNASDAAYFLDILTATPPSSERSAMQMLNRQWGAKVAAVLPTSFLQYSQPAVRQAYLATLRAVEAGGVHCVELTLADLTQWEAAEAILMRILLPEAAAIHRRWWERQDDYAPTTYQQITQGRGALAVDYLAALQAQRAFKQLVDTWFAKYDILLTPTLDFPAPLEDPVIGDVTMDEMRYTGALNVSGHPAVTVNCGQTPEGLPIGLQIVGPAYGDAQVLSFAHWFEQLHPSGGLPKVSE